MLLFITEHYYAATNPNGECSSRSNCTAQCGGGSGDRVRNCESGPTNCQTEKQFCNTEDCVPEPEFRGIIPSNNNYLGQKSLFSIDNKLLPYHIVVNVDYICV